MLEPPRGRSIWRDHIIAFQRRTTWPSLLPLSFACICVGSKHVQMDKPTVRQKDYERIDRGWPAVRRPANPPSHPDTHESWKTYLVARSRMNSWTFSNVRTCNYACLWLYVAISQTYFISALCQLYCVSVFYLYFCVAKLAEWICRIPFYRFC